MDPVSAIGLAANVLQLLDFGSKLLVSGYETYKSQDGTNLENGHIEGLTKSLQSISQKLEQNSYTGKTATFNVETGPISGHEAGLRDLARKSQSLAQDLLRVLERVKGKNKRFRTWGAVRSTFTASWNKDGIQALRKRLMEIQYLINTRLLGLIQNNQMSLRLGIETSMATAELMHQENLKRLGVAEDNLISTIRSLGNQISDSLKRITKRYDSEHDSAVRCYEESLAKLTSVVNGLSPRLESWEKTTVILISLAFSGMDERYDHVEEPCEGTFQWIFKEDANPLPEWLRTGSGLFLITGKAGCGKSTMMKNIYRDLRTMALLEQWARTHERQLITAQFFFWNSGDRLQKTHEGLLRSLLLQALIHCRSLVPAVLPQRWSMEDFRLSKTWCRQELSHAVARLSEQDETKIPCYCFFIDGLDEYQGQMRCLVEDLSRLISSPYIKICAASRPRNVFDRTLRAKHELVLHEHTRSDMHTFVEKRLVNDPAFRRLVDSNPESRRIVKTIQDRAEGVFLWVFLVVQDLLHELDDYGTLEELEDRLRTLPPDLFNFFKRIIESIEQPYKQNVARLLLLLEEAGAPIPLKAVHFLYQDTKDQRCVLSNDLEVRAPDTLEQWDFDTKAQIKKWCRDLLDVDVPGWTEEKGGPEVQFSHQSVRDYMRLPEVGQYLVGQAGDDFHAANTLCRLSLAHLRLALSNFMTTSEFGTMFSTLLNRMMYVAASYEHKTGRTLRELLNRLNEICIATLDRAYLWPPRNSLANPAQRSSLAFLGFAASCGLAIFVREEIGSALENGEGPYLLYSAMRPHWTSLPTFLRAGCLDVITFLLSRGVSPNDKLEIANDKLESEYPATVWERFLFDIWQSPVCFMPGEFLWVVETFLDSGAKSHLQRGSENIPIQKILIEVLKSNPAAVTEHHDKLRHILSAHGIST